MKPHTFLTFLIDKSSKKKKKKNFFNPNPVDTDEICHVTISVKNTIFYSMPLQVELCF